MTDGDDSYRIIDEPRPSRGPWIAVNPFWPLLGMVLSGILPGTLWFLYNGRALGSATRRRELAVAGIGVLGSLVIALALQSFRPSISATVFPYFGLLLVGWKVTIGYLLHIDQVRSVELYTYFGGQLGRGILLLILVIVLSVVFGTIAHTLSPILGALFGERFFLS
ncbi:MAG: hypothetical protein QNJ06_17920 [Kiloniellales bacterium]|nr:hypothetical protein [Kiloniellales bacterium]MDJ0971778.1 hypothetical protein [Kiloniellales bacterium]MDJ0982248.1 hypothetical protein [Kiloniellales bacterium]